MTRQVTDQLYIDLDYFTPEEYFVYTAEAVASAAIESTVSSTVTRIVQGECSLSVENYLSTTPLLIQRSTAQLDSTTTVTAVGRKTSEIVLTALSDSAVTAQAGAIYEMDLTAVTGIQTEAFDPRYFKYYDANLEYNVTAGTVIAQWHKRHHPYTTSEIMRFMTRGVTSGQPYNTDRFYFRTEGSDLKLQAYDETGSGTAQFTLTWSGVVPSDDLYHHYVLKVNSWSGAFPGNISVTAYVDGVSAGTETATGPNTYGIVTTFLDQVWVGYRSSSSHAQLWIGTPSSFNINHFYNSGYVEFADDGTTVNNDTPVIWGLFDYDNLEANWGVYTENTSVVPNEDVSQTLALQDRADDRFQGIGSRAWLDIITQVTTQFGANLVSDTTLTATATVAYVADSNLSVTTTVTADGDDLIKDGEADLSTDFSLSAEFDKFAEGLAQLDSQTTVTAAADGITKSAEANLAVDASISASADGITKSAAATLASEVSIEAKATGIIPFSATFTVETTVTVQADTVQQAHCDLSSDFTQTALANYTVDNSQNLVSDLTVTIDAIKAVDAAATLEIDAGITAIGRKIAEIILPAFGDSTFTATADDRVRDITLGLASTTTVTATPIRLIRGSAGLVSDVTQTARGHVLRYDPFWAIPVLTETRQFTVEPESLEIAVIDDARDFSVEPESLDIKVKTESRILEY